MSEKDSTVVVDPLGGLLLEPSNELRFRGPFDDYVSVSLRIRNPTEKRIAFKIKTTAPKRYCVKPNSGVLDPSQSMNVNVLLQPFNYDPNEKNKHKFMVQYLYLNETEMLLGVNDILNMWKDVPASRLLDLKLKCLFDFNEADQARLNNSAAVASGGVAGGGADNKIEKSSSTSSRTSTASSKSNDTYVQASDLHSNDFESTYTTSKQQTTASAANQIANANLNTNSNNSSTTQASAAANQSSSSSSSSSASSNLTSAASRLDKNDNTLNELKLLRQENDSLKKEINRLKEEESRLRKLALQAPSSSLNNRTQQSDSLADILNNRSTLIIILLIAIVLYLLLFR